MKKYILLILLIYTNISIGQIDTSNLLNTDNQWNVSSSGLDIPLRSKRYILEESDTNGVVYYKVFQSNKEEGDQWTYTKKILKQDSSKIWLYFDYNGKSEPYLLYDFSLEKGDTFNSNLLSGNGFIMVVDKTDSILLLDGTQRKRLQFSCIPKTSIDKITWIEGIGDIRGLLGTELGCSINLKESLLCFYQKGELLWENPDQVGCWITGTKEIVENTFDIYPNPTKDMIKVTLHENSNWQRWSIYDLTGKLRKNGSIYNSFDFTISGLKELGSGMYFLKVYDEQGRVGVGKFVVE